MPAMSFGNAGAALGTAGGALVGLGKKMQGPKQPLGTTGGGMSTRKYRKMLGAKVEAYRQVADIDTQQRGARLQQSTEAMTTLKGAGFHTISHETPDVKISAASEPGVSEDRSYNPSAGVHGHPGEGFVRYHGFTGDAAANPGAHSVITLNPTAVRTTPLALESGKATDLGTQAGSRPGAAAEGPRFKATATDVVKVGSFMDQPEKAQPTIPASLKAGGAIKMGSSATKGKLKGPQLQRSPESGKLTEAGWEAKLSAQEGAELAKRRAKSKKDTY